MLGAASLGWIRAGLPAAPARVLEVGAGEGELAAQLRADGYDVLAIDPREDAGEGVRSLALIELEEPPESFDAAIAMLSLHHVEPLGASVEHLATLLPPGAPLLVDEFDTAAFDRRAAAWLISRWHHQGREVHSDAGALIGDVRDHLHPVAQVRDALEAAGFFVGAAELVAYLHRWHLDPGLRAEEEELIASGELPATGARFSAVRR